MSCKIMHLKTIVLNSLLQTQDKRPIFIKIRLSLIVLILLRIIIKSFLLLLSQLLLK